MRWQRGEAWLEEEAMQSEETQNKTLGRGAAGGGETYLVAMPGGRSLYDVAKASIEHGRDSGERQRMIDIQPILDFVCHWSAMLTKVTQKWL